MSLPISFLIGRAFVEILLFTISIYTISSLKNWKKYIFNKEYLILLLFFYYLFICLSTFINLEILTKATDSNLLLKSLLNFRFIVYILSIWYVLEQIRFNKTYFLFIIGIYFLFLLDGYIQFFYGQNIFGYTITSRITGIFGNEYNFGSYIQKIVPIILILWFLIFKNNKKYFLLLLSLISLSSIIIIFSGDRAALILFFFFLITAFVCLPYLRKILLFNFVITLLLASFIFFAGIGKNLDPLKQRYNINSEYNNINLSIKNLNDSSFLKYIPRDHYGHFLVVNEMLKDNLFFGKGIKSFRVLCRGKLGNLYLVPNGVCSTHPHNYYLQSLSAGGLLAFILLTVIFLIFFIKMIAIFIRLFRYKQFDNTLNLAVVTVFIYFWPLTPTGNFFSNWIAGFNCFVLGMYLFLDSRFKNKNNILTK